MSESVYTMIDSESVKFVDLQFSNGRETSGNEKSSILSDDLTGKASQDEKEAEPDPLVETEMKEEVKEESELTVKPLV